MSPQPLIPPGSPLRHAYWHTRRALLTIPRAARGAAWQAIWAARAARRAVGAGATWARSCARQVELAASRNRLAAAARRGDQRPRVLAIGSWSFPVYSHTFVYQELCELARAGFAVRLACARVDRRTALPPHQRDLWPLRCGLPIDERLARRDRRFWERVAPAAVERLDARVAGAAGMTTGELRGHPDYLRAFSFARLAGAWRPDYLHSYFFYEGALFALVAAELLGVPRGVSCYADHQLDDYELKLAALHLERSAIVVATSQRVREELLRLAPRLAADRVLLKPNGVDVNAFPVCGRAEPAPGEPFRIAAVSRLDPKKGLADLVAAVAQLRDAGLAVELHVAGGVDSTPPGAACAAALRERVAALGLGDRVRFLGPLAQPAVRTLLAACHLFVAPAVETPEGDKDGLPTSLLEAMSTGAAVLATDAGSIPEAIEHDVNGRLVPQQDVAALATGIADLLAAPEVRRRLGSAAADAVRARFAADVTEPLLHARLRALLPPAAAAPTTAAPHRPIPAR